MGWDWKKDVLKNAAKGVRKVANVLGKVGFQKMQMFGPTQLEVVDGFGPEPTKPRLTNTMSGTQEVQFLIF